MELSSHHPHSLSKHGDDEDVPSISPQAVHVLFPSRPAPRISRERVLQRLSEALLRRSLTKLDLSERGLGPSDARLIKMALAQNPSCTVVNLAYNNLGDEGVRILLCGPTFLHQLVRLDLGCNHITDQGCQVLCRALPPDSSQLEALSLGGNLIGQEGALAIADVLIRNKTQHLKKLYLMGNRIGPDGVKALTDAMLEGEVSQHHHHHEEGKSTHNSGSSMEELYLGGTGMASAGLMAVAGLIRRSTTLQVLSLPNCDLGDEDIGTLAAAISSNLECLPLRSLQLSFNRITCQGMEPLCTALWRSSGLRELLVDNNQIADRGAQQVAELLRNLRTMETLDVGFNRLKAPGFTILMKAVADYSQLRQLSVSGNPIDTTAAKAVAYALAFSRTLTSLSVVHCSTEHDGRRHIAAGIVSNSRIVLQKLAGFRLGPIVATLGFPQPTETWNNSQILYFCRLMWGHHRETSNSFRESEEKATDPVQFLPASRTTPQEATIVIEVAKKAYSVLVENGLDIFARQNDASDGATDGSSSLTHQDVVESCIAEEYGHPSGLVSALGAASMPTRKNASFVASPEQSRSVQVEDPGRKRRIKEWFDSNSKSLHKFSELPFDAAELWRLHQHYFSPVVKESGGESIAPSPNPSVDSMRPVALSVPEVSQGRKSVGAGIGLDPLPGETNGADGMVEEARSNQISSSMPMLKRKVSYHHLGDLGAASKPSPPRQHQPVAMMIEASPSLHSLPPRMKRARRNRTRISFLPKAKAKLDSYLDVSHDKALVTMRQLFFVEQAILKGDVHPVRDDTPRTHLCGALALDAECIVSEML